MNFDALDAGIIGPAFAAGLVVLATHIPLGQRVLERGIIFIDLAIAQLAGLGVIAAHYFGLHGHGPATQLAAYATALVSAALLYLCERRWPQVQEAIIGSCFMLAATGSLLLLAGDPAGGEHLRELLVGQILWVGFQQLVVPILITVLVLLAWVVLATAQRQLAFYLLFAIAVTCSVQLVGVYLVFASLIIPALAVRFLEVEWQLTWGYLLGGLGYLFGLLISAGFDLPSGPTIVWSLAGVGLLAVQLRRVIATG